MTSMRSAMLYERLERAYVGTVQEPVLEALLAGAFRPAHHAWKQPYHRIEERKADLGEWIVRSTDGGSSWTDRSSGLPGATVHELVVTGRYWVEPVGVVVLGGGAPTARAPAVVSAASPVGSPSCAIIGGHIVAGARTRWTSHPSWSTAISAGVP